MVIDVFTNQLENDVKAVGVNHHMDNNDETWDVTIWNPWALHALLGEMYLTQGNLSTCCRSFPANNPELHGRPGTLPAG